MPTPLAGPGQGLPLPQNLYPTELTNAPLDQPSNKLTLNAGDVLPLPAGTWFVSAGMYSIVQFQDPITGVWDFAPACGWGGDIQYVKSDGFTARIANLTGCPVSAVVTNYGSGYVQSTTTVTANIGGSTWLPIVGGQLGTPTFASTVAGGTTTTLTGAGYGVAPLVMIPPPPPAQSNPNGVGGIPATAYAVISSGTVSGVTFTNPGAGYNTGFQVVLYPSPADPNLSAGITNATFSFTLTGSGSLTGALCTNNGAPLNANQLVSLTLTVAGAGTTGSLVPDIMQTLLTSTVSGAGTVTGNLTAITSGGAGSAGTITNSPDFLHLRFRPRPAQLTYSGVTAGGTATIIDGGLFLSVPTLTVLGGVNSVAPTLVNTTGPTQDIVWIQPAP